VVTDFPLEGILHNRDATGRISKWAVELGALNIDFTPRKAIKSQALIDFVVKWTEIQQPTLETILDHWKMYFDGSLKLGRAGAGVLFISLDGKNSNMFFKSSIKLQTMKQNTKPYPWTLGSYLSWN
jgi:hypothetical protein